MQRSRTGKISVAGGLYLGLLLVECWAESPAKSGSRLPDYQPSAPITQSFKIYGSGVMANLLEKATKEFVAVHPDTTVELSFPSSAGVLDGLINGSVTFGAMSRPMGDLEKKSFARKYGHEILEICVAQDALQVLVHRHNPIPGLTLDQLDAIYSSVGLRGGLPVTTWGDLGLPGAWVNEPVEPYGGSPGWGTTLTFEGLVSWGALSKASVRPLNIESGVPQAVAANLGAIGYTCLGPPQDGTRTVPVAENISAPFVACTPENVQNGSYSLRRLLYLYAAPGPDGTIDRAFREYLLFLLSGAGQKVVAESGMLPLGIPQALAERQKLQKIAP